MRPTRRLPILAFCFSLLGTTPLLAQIPNTSIPNEPKQSTHSGHSSDYSEQVIIRASPKNTAQLQWLLDHHDVWRRDPRLHYWPVRLRRSDLAKLDQLGIEYRIDEVRTVELHQSLQGGPVPAGATSIPNFPCYRTVQQTLSDLNDLHQQYPQLTRLLDIGDSWHKINGNGNNGHDILDLSLIHI